MLADFSPTSIPTLATVGLSEDEKRLIGRLSYDALRSRAGMELEGAYYDGEQVIRDLGIAIPPELAGLRTLVGWPAMAVDPLVERLAVDGFRVDGQTDGSQVLRDLWDGNGMDAEQSLAFTDALSMRRSFWAVGSPTERGGMPRITVESPLNVVVDYKLDGRTPAAAYQEYWDGGDRHGVLYLPDQTVTIAMDESNEWQVTDRDHHGFGRIPLVRMANRARTANRNGGSEITAVVMSLTDAACRTLLGLEVAREFYSVPQKLILGATEGDFQDAEGVPKKAWDTYISRILALERDEDGNVPEVKQFTPYDPSVFTKLIDMYASQMAGILSAPPQDLGLYTQGNPVSAEAASASESRRDRKAILKQNMFGPSLVETMKMAVRFMHNGDLPAEFERMVCDWRKPTPTPLAVAADAVSKQVAAGVLPPRSDVTLRALGHSAIDRQRIAQDWPEQDQRDILNKVADAMGGASGNVPGA